MKGYTSEGMIICASDASGNLSIVSPSKDMKDGSKLS